MPARRPGARRTGGGYPRWRRHRGPEWRPKSYVRDQSVFATLDSTIKNNLVNTALVQYARRHYGFLGATGQPDFSIQNDLELGHNFGTQDRTAESRVEFADSVSWIKGNHVAKFGFDGNVIRSLFNFPGFTPTRLLILPGAGPAPPQRTASRLSLSFISNGATWNNRALLRWNPPECCPNLSGQRSKWSCGHLRRCAAPNRSQVYRRRAARPLAPITWTPRPGRMLIRRHCLRILRLHNHGYWGLSFRTSGGSLAN